MARATLGRLLLTAGRSASGQASTSASAPGAELPFNAIQRRYMSGGHHGPGVTYEGLTLHRPAGWQKVAGEGFAGLMWFWILVRAYHDGSTLLFGHAQHFEHEEHHEGAEKSH